LNWGRAPRTGPPRDIDDQTFVQGWATWDTETLKPIRSIDVAGRPDGILNDAYNHRVYLFSHAAPNATVIDSATGALLGTIDPSRSSRP